MTQCEDGGGTGAPTGAHRGGRGLVLIQHTANQHGELMCRPHYWTLRLDDCEILLATRETQKPPPPARA